MNAADAIALIAARAQPGKDAEMAAYHKVERRYLGTATPEIDSLCKAWRTDLTLEDRLHLAEDLWNSDIHEARIAAAKLLTQARIRPEDDTAWALICTWVPQFDAWAIADAVCIAAQKRLIADPSRLDTVEDWTQSPLMWARRAALVATLPFAKLNHPSDAESGRLVAARSLKTRARTDGGFPDRTWSRDEEMGPHRGGAIPPRGVVQRTGNHCAGCPVGRAG
jgi:hypothetical protein